jgi:hypothetical protein
VPSLSFFDDGLVDHVPVDTEHALANIKKGQLTLDGLKQTGPLSDLASLTSRRWA